MSFAALRGRVRRLWSSMRWRTLGALVLTALVTLAAVAFALLAPLESTLKDDSAKIGESRVAADRAALAQLPVGPRGEPRHDALDDLLERFVRQNSATYVIWDDALRRVDDTDRGDRDPRDKVAPAVVRRALHPLRNLTTPPYTLSSDVLVVTIRYQGRSFGGRRGDGRRFVLEMIERVDAVTIADSVVRSAFLYAALVGLAVAVVLGIALSWRLVRRLRLLRDASRSFDRGDLSALAISRDEVPDEIGELARSLTAMHERLERQEQARRVFVATASHELRTPLTSLEGALELLAEDLGDEPVDVLDARERVASARRQARRLSALATDLLDLTRIDARLPLRDEPVELGEIARAVAAEFDQRARERGVNVALEEQDGAWAQADPSSVARIVRILLDNALRFAPPSSAIVVRTGVIGGGPAIEVADEGPGVPAEERELIFERFQRGRNSGEQGGFGLGLAIGSELAERMGGRLELDERAAGATFRVQLRAASVELPEPERVAPEAR